MLERVTGGDGSAFPAYRNDHKAEIDGHIAEQNAYFDAHAEEDTARRAELIRRYEARTGKKWEGH